jgi:hypothetical protein
MHLILNYQDLIKIIHHQYNFNNNIKLKYHHHQLHYQYHLHQNLILLNLLSLFNMEILDINKYRVIVLHLLYLLMHILLQLIKIIQNNYKHHYHLHLQ